MALQKIIDKILSHSREEAERLKAEARAEADKIIEQGREDARAEKDSRLRNAREKMENNKRRRLALANLESRKKILNLRCSMIDEVFDQVVLRLNELKGERLRKLVTGLLGDFVLEAECEVHCKKSEIDKFTLLLSSLWGEKFTRYCKVRGVEGDIGGGFILRSHKMEYDCTFKSLVMEKRESLELEVSKILFAGFDSADNKSAE